MFRTLEASTKNLDAKCNLAWQRLAANYFHQKDRNNPCRNMLWKEKVLTLEGHPYKIGIWQFHERDEEAQDSAALECQSATKGNYSLNMKTRKFSFQNIKIMRTMKAGES